MLLLYTRIFSLIKRHHQQRSLGGSLASFNSASTLKTTVILPEPGPHETRKLPKQLIVSLPWCNSCLGPVNPIDSPKEMVDIGVETSNKTQENEDLNSNQCSGDVAPQTSSNYGTDKESGQQISAYTASRGANKPGVHGHRKALITTLIILGTYLICWMPAVLFLAITCIDGCPFPLYEIPKKTAVVISFISNSLVVMKAIVDPFIYSFRMKEVRIAIRRLFRRYPCCRWLNKRPPNRKSFNLTSQRSATANSTINPATGRNRLASIERK